MQQAGFAKRLIGEPVLVGIAHAAYLVRRPKVIRNLFATLQHRAPIGFAPPDQKGRPGCGQVLMRVAQQKTVEWFIAWDLLQGRGQ